MVTLRNLLSLSESQVPYLSKKNRETVLPLCQRPLNEGNVGGKKPKF